MNKYDARVKVQALGELAKTIDEPALTLVYELIDHLVYELEKTSDRARLAVDVSIPDRYGR